jgi:hypothetical protein
MKKLISKDFLLLAIFLLVILFFYRLLSLNFVADDFSCLLNSKAQNVTDYLTFFTPSHSFITMNYNLYRPLTYQFYFALMQSIFGLRPIYYHLVSLVWHLLNIVLVFKLAGTFFPKKKSILPILAAGFYALNQSHTVTLAWSGLVQELGLTTFVLLAIYFFYRNLETMKKSYLIFVLIFFVLGLLSKETAIILPVILTVEVLFFGKRKDFIKLVFFFAILLLYLYMHFIKYHFTQTENYTLEINQKVINTLRWYILWAIGLPELFLDYIGSRFTIVPTLWKMFYWEALIIFSLFFTFLASVIGAVFLVLRKNSKAFFYKPLWFFILFYFIFLIPVLFFPQNKYPFHQTTSLVGFSIAVAYVLTSLYELKYKIAKVLLFLSLVSFVLLSYFSINLTLRTEVIINRSRLVDGVFTPFLTKYPTLPENSIIYIKNDPNYPKITESWGGTAKQTSMALNGDFAFKLYYGSSVEVYYEGIKDLPEKINSPKFIEYTAKIPY